MKDKVELDRCLEDENERYLRNLEATLAPLDAGPIEIDESTTTDELAARLEMRLDALLFLLGCEPTPEGWREFALRLALAHRRVDNDALKKAREKGKYVLKYRRVMEVVTPVTSREGSSGAPKKIVDDGYNVLFMNSLINSGQAKDAAQAAEIILGTKDRGKTKKLRNLHSRSKNEPIGAGIEFVWDRKIMEALGLAADRLEAREREERERIKAAAR